MHCCFICKIFAIFIYILCFDLCNIINAAASIIQPNYRFDESTAYSTIKYPCRIVVEGWRNIPHSYSIVSTYFYHNLVQSIPSYCEVFFYDVPFWNPKWKSTTKTLYDKAIEKSMQKIKLCNLTTWRNITIRISFPYNINNRKKHCKDNNEDYKKTKIFVIGTSEFLSVNNFIYWDQSNNNNNNKSSLKSVLSNFNFYNENMKMITHSSWSRAGFINTGIFPRKILNIPLGVNSNIYYELSKKQKIKKRIEILNQGEEDDDGDDDSSSSNNDNINNNKMIDVDSDGRSNSNNYINIKKILNIKSSDKIVFFTVGAMTRNKGMDVLLSTFHKLIKYKPNCCLLLLKGLDDLYSPVEYLKHLVQIYKLPENSIKYIGGIFSSEDMNLLYNIADLYISPYRGEGFNMPVLEAMSVGLPVLVSAGGSTDDFVPFYRVNKFQPFIKTKFQQAPQNLTLVDDGMTKMLEPSKENLLKLLKEFIENKDKIQEIASGVNKRQSQQFSWKHFTEKIISLF